MTHFKLNSESEHLYYTSHLQCSDAAMPVFLSKPSNSPLSKYASLNPVISVLTTELVNKNEIYC